MPGDTRNPELLGKAIAVVRRQWPHLTGSQAATVVENDPAWISVAGRLNGHCPSPAERLALPPTT